MRILVATDGSTEATQAVEWAIQLPLPDDTRVEVVNAVPWPLLDPRVSKTATEFRRAAESIVEDAASRVAKRWPGVTTCVLDGDPRDAVVDAAWKHQADLIIVGARGLGALTAFLLGRVSLGIVRHAPCPVLVCRGAPRPVRAITVGIDGSEDSRVALRDLTDWPLPAEVALHLVGAVEPMRYPSSAPEMISDALVTALQEDEDERRRRMAQTLDATAAELRTRFATVTTATPVGTPAPAIIHEADQGTSDLIVVGARGLGHLKRILLGSVSESVLRHATCPVLIARRRG